jgi:hypothetical protein
LHPKHRARRPFTSERAALAQSYGALPLPAGAAHLVLVAGGIGAFA